MFDHYKDFAYSTVAVGPAPALTGLTLTLQPGDGLKFPEAPFDAVVGPIDALPLLENAEKVRITAKEVDTLTIERHQAGTKARAIGTGDQIFAGVSAKTLTDLQGAIEAETTRAEGAEGTLATGLSAEVTRAEAAETTLATNLAAEAATRAVAITAAITTAEGASDAAGTASAAVATEVANAKAREKVVQEAAEAASAQGLVPTAVKAAAYEPKPGEYVPVDISAGAVPLQLPTAPPDKTRIGGKVVKISGTPGSTALTFNCGGADVFNVAAGSTILTLTAKNQGFLVQYQASTKIWYVQATDTPLNQALGAAQLGSDGKVGGPGGSPLGAGILTYAPAPSGDETGVTDTAALAAAMPARGTLVLRAGDYFGSLPVCGPGQGIIATGMGTTTMWMVGAGVCFRVHNAAMSTAGGEPEFINNMPGRCGGFVIDGTHASAGAVGFQVGDINCARVDDLIVRHFSGAGSVGFLFKSEVAWCERTLFLNCLALNNTIGVLWDNAGTGTGSFDSSHFEIQVMANSGQHGFVMQGGIQMLQSSAKLGGGPFFSGVGNTGVLWKLGADNSNVVLSGMHMEFQAEIDGSEGTGHKTIEMGTKAEYHGEGTLWLNKGGTVSFAAGNVNANGVRFTHSGAIRWDSNLGENQAGEALNVAGGSTWTAGAPGVAEGQLKIGVNGGDWFKATLASGANVLKLNNVYPGRARRIYLILKQPAAGEAATVDWSAPGNNIGGNAQAVEWAGGGSVPFLQTAHGAIDVIQLITDDGQHWYGSVLLSNVAAVGEPTIINANTTYNIPPGAKYLRITCVGGGGGGGGGGSAAAAQLQTGGGGGAAGTVARRTVEVGAATTAEVVVGAGGAGGGGGEAAGKEGASGSEGKETKVKVGATIVRGWGGAAGAKSAASSITAVGGGIYGGAGTAGGTAPAGYGGASAAVGGRNVEATGGGGGGGGAATATNGGGAGGAGTTVAAGTAGASGGSGTSAGVEGESAAANSGAGGGGGGGGAAGTGAGGKGGAGGSGYVLIEPIA